MRPCDMVMEVASERGALSSLPSELPSCSPSNALSLALSRPLATSLALLRRKACSRLEAMNERVTKKIMKKRAQGSLTFTLGQGVNLGVKLFTMIREAGKFPYVTMDANSYPVKPVTKWACKDTGQILRAAQMKKYLPYGSAKVVFEPDEISKIKFLYPQGIQLLGFKSRSSLKDHHNISHSSFLFPDETQIKGSSLTFRSLLQNMVEKDKIAMVRYVPRANSVPRIAALLPSIEQYDPETGIQLQPSGFHLIMLPYEDEVRKLEVEQDFDEATPSDEAVIAARKMVQTFTTDFDPNEFQNPALQKHFRMLETFALKNADSDVAMFEDMVQPDLEGIRQFKPVIDEWRQEVLPEDYAGAETSVKKESKKRAPAREVEGYTGDWDELVSNDNNARYITIPQIKQKLREMGITGRGKKADMWEQLKTAMENADGARPPTQARNDNNGDNDDDDGKPAPSKKTRIKKERIKLEDEEEF